MTDNDYIAEYVREKHPGILGVDFAIWKAGKVAAEGLRNIVKTLSGISYEEIKDYMEDYQAAGDEENPEVASEEEEPEAAGDMKEE